MNKARRNILFGISTNLSILQDRITSELVTEELESIKEELQNLKAQLDECREDEEYYADNMPENLQGSTRYDNAMDAVSNMEDAEDNIEEVINSIDNGDFEEAADYISDAIDNIQDSTF